MIDLKFVLSWDAAKVVKAAEKAARRALRKIGFQTRMDAMNSIRQGVGSSPPGHAPYDKVGTLRRFIIYQMDDQAKSVVIGPKFLRKKSKDAPSALEKGGTATNYKGRVIRVEKRPFMVPAFERVKRQQVPAVFANSLY